MRMRCLHSSHMFALLLLFAPALTLADAPASDTGTITGKVLDADGKPVKGASVIAREFISPLPKGAPAPDPKDKKTPKTFATAVTDEDGTYKLEKVPVGLCKVGAHLEASTDTTWRYARNVTVIADKTATATDIKFTKSSATKPSDLP